VKAHTLAGLLLENPNAEVIIETDKQLLPNAEYNFDIDKGATRVVLRPKR
jgi:hypothetical protein